MFPSTGHFRSLHCPYYLEDNNCKRIYCHFRHAKNETERTNENTSLLNLEKQICNELKLDKELFDILMDEEDDNVHVKLLNRKLKAVFPGYDKIIDGLRFPETSTKDNFDFNVSNTSSDDNIQDLINLTEQPYENVDDTPLDEGPLKQFLEENAKRSSNSDEQNHNTIEKRHIIISCLEKIDKKEYGPRRGIIRPRNFARMINDNVESVNGAQQSVENVPKTNCITNSSIGNQKLKQENDTSENSSDDEDFAEVDSILTQMELLKPQLLDFGKKEKEMKSEPTETEENSRIEFNNRTGEYRDTSMTNNTTSADYSSISTDDIATQPYDTPVFQKPIANRSNNRFQANAKPVYNQLINEGVEAIQPPPPIKIEHENLDDVLTQVVTPILTPVETVAEQNRLKNLFKNTICSNIDQFFDLSDACKVYGTQIFNLIEPLFGYLVEKLNPQFDFQKLRQLHCQNISLSCGLPFVTLCDHLKNCLECHNIVVCALSKCNVKKTDKSTEIREQINHDTPLRKIEAGLYDITKEMISLGIPVSGTTSKPDTKDAECQTSADRKSHSKENETKERRRSDHNKHRSKESERHKSKSSECKPNNKHDETKLHDSVKLSSSSSSSSGKHKSSKSKRSSEKKRSHDDDDASEDEASSSGKQRKKSNSSHGESESRKRTSTSSKHSTEAKKSKLDTTSRPKSSHEDERKKNIVVEISDDDECTPAKYENNDFSDHDNDTVPLDSDSDNYSDIEQLCDSASRDDRNVDQNKDKETGVFLFPSASVKKRVSHVTDSSNQRPHRKPFVAKKHIPSPSEVLFQRTQTKEAEKNANDAILNCVGNNNERVRISHVPNVALLLKAKEQIKQNLMHKTKPTAPVRTTAQTNPRGQNRTAHMVNEPPPPKDVPAHALHFKPVINSFKANNNIPLPTRQFGLEKLFNAFAKKVPPELASELALKEETVIHEKTKVTKVYLNSLLMSVCTITKTDPAKLFERTSEFPTEINGHTTYNLLSKYLLTTEQFEINGFPLAIQSKPGCCRISSKAVHYKSLSSKRNGDRFYCLQCKDLFELCPETGLPITPSPGCRFHGLRPRKERGRTREDMYFPCCNKNISESGCMSAEFHTLDTTNDDYLEGFVETREAPPGENAKQFYSLDCEMCYTTEGVELTRVTVIGYDCNAVYDSLVMPRNRILDYCTKFSGITEVKLRNVTKTLEDVRRELFKFIFKTTILIGHSLENDLRALKILHFKVVDTSVMYPHRDAPERKFSLKYISSNFAQFLIQESEHGHDSQEDALACMKLVWKKIREDAQIYRPRKIIGSPERQKN